MPFWGDSSKEHFKAKLEHKMCIAKETPESDFDLSDCNLSEIPSGVFSMCRVFLKKSLLLQSNQLTSLRGGGSLKDLNQLLVLNLKDNKIASLPEDFSYLASLQELNLENNRLKKLPISFSRLANLRCLNLKNNKLTAFPEQICSLTSLEDLNLLCNSKIKLLPQAICNLHQLKSFDIDTNSILYPPNEVCNNGLECIMKFFCDEMGKEYSAIKYEVPQKQTDDESSNPDSESSDLSAPYLQYQRAKEQRQKDLILMEEALKENSAVQSTSSVNASSRRQKLLEDIVQEQERMEGEIMLLQNKKEKEKQNLLSILANVENHSAQLIEQLMILNDRTKNIDKMLAVLEKDRLENEEMFTVKQEELEQLRKKEVLEAMTEMLRQEEKHRKYEIEKDSIAAELQNNENESNLKLLNIFQEREIDQQILINSLLEQEQYQKEAFEALQLQKDLRHQDIIHQIHLIEKELSGLTHAEIKKRNLKIDSEVNSLAEHRTALAYLLTELLSAKEQREKQLRDRLQQMELKRADEMKDFWLIQYQKLLDSKPKGVVDAELEMDPDVKRALMNALAVDYLPLFAVKRITFSELLTFTAQDLKNIGVLDESACLRILGETQGIQRKNERGDFPLFKEGITPEPSAPPVSDPSSPELSESSTPSAAEFLEGVQPSAPLLSPDSEIKLWRQAECVVCMDVQSTAVFLPCGHVCCCQNCSSTISLCPMCRTAVASRFILTMC
ncbi:E3 ubiquitin-protein ligase LRSAM1-like [Uloborus diversus]|uniref:E3 ubiquitin-protein ligase LRSAM1-like n=1 Tax=Uloborus diversus TaxID=327109 RepID=UPI00240A07DB|nr:E3 ubiquitin-protein ligase LRSAM1-like [Uloborus diversus]